MRDVGKKSIIETLAKYVPLLPFEINRFIEIIRYCVVLQNAEIG